MSADTWHVRDHRLIHDYEPFDAIRKGDVILWNGRLCTVRQVTQSQEDAVRCVTFAILRPSWTNRPFTTYCRTEIRKAFGGIVAHRKDPSLCVTETECLVQKEIESPTRRHAGERDRITAREMAGVIW